MINYLKYPVRVCRTVHHCDVCGKSIAEGQKYHDGGHGRRAHFLCHEAVEALDCVLNNNLNSTETIEFLREFMAEVFCKLGEQTKKGFSK
jgi:hypothetical protein